MQESVAMLRVGDIVPNPNQPRRKFAPAAMAEFEESVRANGVIQAITVRPLEDGKHMLIAGERRWRAARSTRGEDWQIPAVIKDVSEEEALAMGITENVDRENMNAAEEAEAVDKLASIYDGDLDEVSRRLGWPLLKVKRRVALMRATPEVRHALLDDQISLGHAEVLAAAPVEMQSKALPKIITNKLTVDDVKQALMARTYVLAKAVFDRGECENCPSNTGIQKTLFTTALDAGRCTNTPCFDTKTGEALDAIAAGLRDTYPRVEIIRIDNKIPATTLEADGPNGVGAEQAKACRACKDFGASVSALPGEHGSIAKSQCFNLKCNAEKRKAHAEASKPEPVATQLVTPDKGSPAPTAKPQASTQGTATEAEAKPAAAPKPLDPKSLRQAIIDHRKPIWQQALKRIALKDHALGLRLLVILAASGELRSLPDDDYATALCKALGAKHFGRGRGDADQKVIEADDVAVAKYLAGIVAASADSMSAEVLQQLLVASGKQLEDYWKVDKAFLDVLTKSEIDVVAKQIGVAAHMGDTYRSLLNKKKDELIEAVLKSGFEFTSKVPSFMKWRS